eukprot:TRINITY_DN34633_c0_g1_i1.p1 TRINITY_DN34633_c0_g1~~TRINITY_DN34633_c0_g1_i1.p1  ORF type:complete len:223 (-),score=11.23 TRINITY_DN34633_c0_g1_i1:200-868(-)
MWYSTINTEIREQSPRKSPAGEAKGASTTLVTPPQQAPTGRPSDSPVRHRVLSIAEEQLSNRVSESNSPPPETLGGLGASEGASAESGLEASMSPGGIVRLSVLDSRGRPRLASETRITQNLRTQSMVSDSSVSRKTVHFHQGDVSGVCAPPDPVRGSEDWNENGAMSNFVVEQNSYSNRHSGRSELTESLMSPQDMNDEMRHSQQSNKNKCTECCKSCVIA